MTKLRFSLWMSLCAFGLPLLMGKLAAEDGALKHRLLMSKIKGAQSPDAGRILQCEIYDNHPEIAPRLKDLEAKIAKIEKIPLTESYHIMAANPSLEYKAYLKDSKALEIFTDSGTLKERKGPLSLELMNLMDSICGK